MALADASTRAMAPEEKPVVTTSRSTPTLSVGVSHTCFIDSGSLYCWGLNDQGQLGVGDTDDRTVPVRVAHDTWISVAAGLDHTCAILGDTATARRGSIHCWGSNHASTPVTTIAPERVGAESGWTWVAAGVSHTCGILDGALHCWGDNGFGQLGREPLAYEPDPSPVGSRMDWTWVTAWKSTCAIASGELYCWGVSTYGQLGTGSGRPDFYDVLPDPERVGTDGDWTSVALGGWHGCGTRSRGELWCWGYNNFSQLGDPDWPVVIETPRLALSGTTGWQPATTHLGGNFTCWIHSGDLHCWGRNQAGQLGIGTAEFVSDPVLVSEGDWEVVTTNGSTACGLRAGALYCWGLNDYGQLGVGDTTDRYDPTRVEVGGP